MHGLTMKVIGVWGIRVFLVVMVIALGIQIWDIIKRQSVKSISTYWIVYFAAMFLSGVIYGAAYYNTDLLINNAVLAVLHIVIVVAILKFRGFNRQEWLFTATLVLALGLMLVSDRRDYWFFGFAPGGVLALLKQAHQIGSNRNVGVVDVRLLIAYVLTNVFWTAYAFAIHDWTLQIICPANLVACAILLATWCLVRQTTKHPDHF